MAGRIKLLGKPAILDDQGRSQNVRGHQAWALLARVALARRPVERRALAAELFLESVDPLGSLRWCLAALRKALNASDCLVGDPIELRLPEGMILDLQLLEQDDLPIEDMGPLLDGIDPQCGPEFATWLLVERARIASVIDGRVRREALRALSTHDFERAIRAAEMAVQRDSFDEGAHVLLIKALALAGRNDAALAHAEATERLFVAELGAAPSQALKSAARLSVASPPGGVSPEAHVRSLIRSGVSALAAGAPDAGIETLRQAVAQSGRTQDAHLVAEATLELGRGLVHAVRGLDDEGSILLRQCAEIAGAKGDEKIACAAYTELGYVEALAGRRPEAQAYLDAALPFAVGSEERAAVHSIFGFNLVDWGRNEPGMEHYAVALEHARSAGDRRREIWILGLGARGQLAAGRINDAETALRACLDLVDDANWIAFRPWPVAVLGEARLRLRAGPASLRAPLEEAFALSCQLRDPCWEAVAARSLALTYEAEGNFPRAAQWLDEAYTRCNRVTDPYVSLRVEILADRVEMSRKLGRNDAASTLAREWIAQAARAHMDPHVARAARFLATAGSLRAGT